MDSPEHESQALAVAQPQQSLADLAQAFMSMLSTQVGGLQGCRGGRGAAWRVLGAVGCCLGCSLFGLGSASAAAKTACTRLRLVVALLARCTQGCCGP